MTLEEAIVAFESRFVEVTRVIGFPYGSDSLDSLARDWSRAPTGEHYQTYVTGGCKPQGEPMPGSAFDTDGAVEGWFKYLPAITLDAGARLCWREMPSIEQLRQRGPKPKFYVYSRFAITDRRFSDWVYNPAAMVRENA
jgi:hypothetical protein